MKTEYGDDDQFDEPGESPELRRFRKLTIADVVAVMSDKAWLRGWIIGLTTGVALSMIVWGMTVWLG